MEMDADTFYARVAEPFCRIRAAFGLLAGIFDHPDENIEDVLEALDNLERIIFVEHQAETLERGEFAKTIREYIGTIHQCIYCLETIISEAMGAKRICENGKTGADVLLMVVEQFSPSCQKQNASDVKIVENGNVI